MKNCMLKRCSYSVQRITLVGVTRLESCSPGGYLHQKTFPAGFCSTDFSIHASDYSFSSSLFSFTDQLRIVSCGKRDPGVAEMAEGWKIGKLNDFLFESQSLKNHFWMFVWSKRSHGWGQVEAWWRKCFKHLHRLYTAVGNTHGVCWSRKVKIKHVLHTGVWRGNVERLSARKRSLI